MLKHAISMPFSALLVIGLSGVLRSFPERWFDCLATLPEKVKIIFKLFGGYKFEERFLFTII
jgi:hypothetical protein